MRIDNNSIQTESSQNTTKRAVFPDLRGVVTGRLRQNGPCRSLHFQIAHKLVYTLLHVVVKLVEHSHDLVVQVLHQMPYTRGV